MKNIKKKLLISALCLLPILASGCDIDSNKTEQERNINILSEGEAINVGRSLYDKATEIYEISTLIPYCGYNYTLAISNASDEFSAEEYDNLKYLKTNYKSLDDLKNALRSYLSDELINGLITQDAVIDLRDLKLYSNYLIKDNVLYCRAYTGAGYMTLYANDYEMSIKSIDENKITFNIKSKYAKQNASQECINAVLDNTISSSICNADDFEYKDTTFTINKNSNNNWVVTEFVLHN